MHCTLLELTTPSKPSVYTSIQSNADTFTTL